MAEFVRRATPIITELNGAGKIPIIAGGTGLYIQALVEGYGVKVDPVLHQEVLERYHRLDIAPYKGFINPVYTAVKDKDGNITDVKIDYTEGYAEQMLRYSRDYSNLPLVNE